MPVKTPLPYEPYVKLDQIIRITLRPPEEANISPPTVLPTSEPTTAQYSKTLANTDFPTFSPSNVIHTTIAQLHLVGTNTAGAANTLNWRMLRNGMSVSVGFLSVPAGQFWRLFISWFGVNPGDLLEVRLWASLAGMNYDYNGLQLHPTRFRTVEGLNAPQWVNFTSFVQAPTLVAANAPSGIALEGFRPVHLDWVFASLGAPAAFEILVPRATMGLGRQGFGDVVGPINAGAAATAATRAALTQIRNWMPTLVELSIWRLW